MVALVTEATGGEPFDRLVGLIDRNESRLFEPPPEQTNPCALEIQFQAAGPFAVIFHHGVETLDLGDFTGLSSGCAYASAIYGPSQHLSVQTLEKAPAAVDSLDVADGPAARDDAVLEAVH